MTLHSDAERKYGRGLGEGSREIAPDRRSADSFVPFSRGLSLHTFSDAVGDKSLAFRRTPNYKKKEKTFRK